MGEIKEDLLKNLSKNRQFFLDKLTYNHVLPNYINFNVEYYNKNYDFTHYIGFKKYIDFGVGERCVNKFVKGILKAANYMFF